MGTSHSRTSTVKHEGYSYEDFWEGYCPNKERMRVHFDNSEDSDTKTDTGCNQRADPENPVEGYIYGSLTTDPDRAFGKSPFTSGFDARSQKNLHSMMAMKDLEESQKKQPENKTPEKFRGFAYKAKSVEPFEKVYVNY